jgi:hypothetical protein
MDQEKTKNERRHFEMNLSYTDIMLNASQRMYPQCPSFFLEFFIYILYWIDFVPRCLSSPRQTPRRPCTEHHSEKKNCIAMMYCKKAKVNYVF